MVSGTDTRSGSGVSRRKDMAPSGYRTTWMTLLDFWDSNRRVGSGRGKGRVVWDLPSICDVHFQSFNCDAHSVFFATWDLSLIGFDTFSNRERILCWLVVVQCKSQANRRSRLPSRALHHARHQLCTDTLGLRMLLPQMKSISEHISEPYPGWHLHATHAIKLALCI